MRIALLGGTGDIGEGLALRWAHDTDHEVLIGSRDADRARERATEYETELADRGRDRTVNGFENGMAAERGDVVVLAVPPYYARDVTESIADRLADGAILVSPAVGMSRDDDGVHYDRPAAGSVTQVVAESAPAGVPVVGAYHTLPAERLANLDDELGMDTVIVGDDDDAKGTVTRLSEEIEGLRALDAGPLVNAAEVEGLTPLVINLKRYNRDFEDVSVQFH